MEATFRLLSDGPRPIALDGSAIVVLPDREIPLRELRTMLLHPSVAFSVRDAALRALVERAQAEGGRRTGGLASPALGQHRPLDGLGGRAADVRCGPVAAHLSVGGSHVPAFPH